MTSFLTPLERRLATVLPCTAAGVVVWYSRWWRLREYRIEAIANAAMLLGIILALVWVSSLPMHTVQPHVLSAGGKLGLVGGMLLSGGVSGWRSSRRTSFYLHGHWLAWCMQHRHYSNERKLRCLWGGLRGAVSMACIGVVASHWFVISGLAVATAVAVFFTGFVFAFFANRERLNVSISTSAGSGRGFVRIMPAAPMLQMPRPRTVGFFFIVAMLAISIAAVCAVRIEHPGMLGMAVAISAIAFIFLQTLLVAGATELHRLLAWTGVAPWRAVSRLLWFPVAIAAGMAAPIAIAAVVLHQPIWILVVLVGLVIACYVGVIWVVSDLVGMGGGRRSIFRMVNTIFPLVALVAGPIAVLILPLHLGWLIRRGHHAWMEKV
ncbi:hypothetical protein XBLMG947_1542 [Xanthomonas bromi]|uniref:Transmembrane protein n=1 Tax=Xanthomonas bromi TaxID=56449 RepID=A0A1C3NK17_9XANT|nr:hypothetical protein [Xanthomonas bromi]PPV07663.1 hypothetical protein XbrCFBP1976_06290 [Xanthomonas bromi]SBV50760.1 hypothetical protein XBLMG947_1542 [Xanthomonas bromi]